MTLRSTLRLCTAFLALACLPWAVTAAPAAAQSIPSVDEPTVVRRIPASLWKALAANAAPDPSGATGVNIAQFTGVQTAREGSLWAGYGLAASDTAAVENALLIHDYGFAHQQPDGGFATLSSKKHPAYSTAWFVQDVGHTMLLLQADRWSSSQPAIASRLAKQRPAAASALAYMMANRADLAADVAGTNRLFLRAGAFYLVGEGVGNADAVRVGDTFIQSALAHQASDGTFLEAKGFDSSYQCVSLAFAQELFVNMPSSDPLRVPLWTAIVRGMDRERQNLLPTGEISTAGNTRIGPDSKGGKHSLDMRFALLAFEYYSALTQDPRAQADASLVLGYYGPQLGS